MVANLGAAVWAEHWHENIKSTILSKGKAKWEVKAWQKPTKESQMSH